MASVRGVDAYDVMVVGGGPAGLIAAETAAGQGMRVALADAMPSVGRKLLVAGRGGLNLTHGEDLADFAMRYSGPEMPKIWPGLLEEFSPEILRTWAADLGIETFQQRTGRVYPREMKAAPLLRRWIERLKLAGVAFHMKRRWTGLAREADFWRLDFADAPSARATAVVFALGGASWPRTGSDGGWLARFRELGIACHDLQPANCGWEVHWPLEILQNAEGLPLKNIAASVGVKRLFGELMITRYGLEGGLIYALGADLRAVTNPEITIDFKPSFTCEKLVKKFGSKTFSWSDAKVRWRVSDAALAILRGKACANAEEAAKAIKCLKIPLIRPRPIAEAISSAGGICWGELDASLGLRRFPGAYVAGEMIDWEAPTGGYLMQGCFATGKRAGGAAADFVKAARLSKPPA